MKQKQTYFAPCSEEINFSMRNAIMDGTDINYSGNIEPDDGGEATIL